MQVSQKNRNFAHVIELQRHIEISLLNNDCVIVPDFGGFVAHTISARYDEHDHTLLPPKRMLGFNPQLRINDSLLVQSYITAYDISYPEALRRIESEVEELKDALDINGIYTLDNIGTLTVNTDGNIEFEPCEAGVLTPDYYALGAVEFYQLKDRVEFPVAEVQKMQVAQEVSLTSGPALIDFTDNETDDEERTVKIKLSWIRNAVAIAAAIVAFFIMVTPISNSNLQTQTMSQLQSKLLYKLMPQDSNMAPATPVEDVKEALSEEATKPSEAKEPAKPTEVKEKTYCIVLASQVKQSNAEYYVEQLKKQGYKQASVYIHNNVVRVIYGAYATEAEAYNQLNKMNNKEEFYEAWVYKKVES